MTVRTRIAPSPTGEDLHIGNLYTGLLNYAFAKKHNGQFIIRIEDTDRSRLIEKAEGRILDGLKQFGLIYDEGPDVGGASGPYRQSERVDTYHIYAKELLEKGSAYYCFCTKDRLDKLRKKQQADKQMPRYDKHCLQHTKDAQKRVDQGEQYVIRLNVPEKKEIAFNDLLRGEIKIKSENVDDQVLMKSDGFPTYHLAVVVDDHFMKISHVIRGDEWISSTPKHILLYEAFGWEKPIYVHTPLLRNADKSKFSKRKNPVWAHWYLEHGFLPEAVINYLSLMGWSHPKQKEIFDIDEFISVFDPKDMHVVGPVFDIVKLEWMNGEYIRKANNEELTTKIYEFYKGKYAEEMIEKTVPLVKERMKRLTEYATLCEFFYKSPEEYQIDLKSHKNIISKMHDELKKLKEWNAEAIGHAMQELAAKEKMKNSEFFMILRIVISGKKITPPLNESIELLGKAESLKRLSV
ncbi:MAG: glutamate--tRNA ligase [Patescibacteria group bacterium]